MHAHIAVQQTQRICERPRWLTTVHVEHIAVGVVWCSVDGVVVWQKAVLLEVLSFVEAYRAHVRCQHVQVDGLTVVLFG